MLPWLLLRVQWIILLAITIVTSISVRIQLPNTAYSRQTGFNSYRQISMKLQMRQQQPKSIPHELSPYYHQDRRERDLAFGSPIKDPIGLAKLLKKRYDASVKSVIADRDYVNIRHIDEQLLQNHNVVVYQHPRIWSRLGSHSPPNGIKIQEVQKQHRALQRMYGPTRHPYQHVGDTVDRDCNSDYDCDIHITEIHSLLSQYTLYRQRCKNNSKNQDGVDINDQSSSCSCNDQRSCETADAIRLELRMHGVRLSDITHQWTTHPTYNIDTDDDDGHHHQQAQQQQQQQPLNVDSVKNGKIQAYYVSVTTLSPGCLDGMTSSDIFDERQPDSSNRNRFVVEQQQQQQQQIGQLLKERHDAWIREEYKIAAYITYELYCTYRVIVNDDGVTNKEQSWYYDDQCNSTTTTGTTSMSNSNAELCSVPQQLPLLISRKRNQPPLPPPPMTTTTHLQQRFPSLILFQGDGFTLKSTTRYRELIQHEQSLSGTNNSNSNSTIIDSSTNESHSVIQQQHHDRIRTLIQHRIQKREEGKFLEADTIRNVLWHTYVRGVNIGINDRRLQYSYGGIFDDE